MSKPIINVRALKEMGIDSRRVKVGKTLFSLLPPELRVLWKEMPDDEKLEVLQQLKNMLRAARDADPIAAWWDMFTADQMAFLLDPAMEKICSGGNRAGKTRTGCYEDVVHFTGRYPEGWPETHKFRIDRPRFVWVASPDRMVQTEPGGVQDTILDLLPPGSIKTSPKVTGNPIALNFIEGWDGSRIIFKAYGAGQDVFMSAGIHHIHYDEEPPQAVYFEALQRGIEFKGTTNITMTPVKGITWVYERLVKPGHVPVHYIVTADNPIVDTVELDRRSAAMTKIERLVRRSGRFLPMVGSPRFDIEPFSEALEMARNPAKWIDLMANPEDPEDHSRFIVAEATEVSYRPLALYIDPRGRKGWKNRFVIGADTSEGKEASTECAATVIDRLTMSVAGVLHGMWDPEEWAKVLARLGHFFNIADICPEANNMGIIVVRDLVHSYGAVYVREKAQTTVGDVTEEFGWWTSHPSKARMEGHCIPIFNEIGLKGKIDLAYGPLIAQGMTYQRTIHGTGHCAPGTMDDILISCMLAYMMDQQAPAIREPGWKKKEKEKNKLRRLRKASQRRGKEKTSWMSH